MLVVCRLTFIHGYEYNMTITVGTKSSLKIWYAFDLTSGDMTKWYYHGPFTNVDTPETLYINTDIKIAGSSPYNDDFWRLYLASFGNNIENTLTILEIIATKKNISRSDPNYSRLVFNITYDWVCSTSTSGCCTIRFAVGNNYINWDQSWDPCQDWDGFLSNRGMTIPPTQLPTIPSVSPTPHPTNDYPTNIPTNMMAATGNMTGYNNYSGNNGKNGNFSNGNSNNSGDYNDDDGDGWYSLFNDVDFELGVQLSFIVSFSFPLILFFFGFVYHKQSKFIGCDFPSFGNIFRGCFAMADFYSDILFSLLLLIESHWLYIYSLIFTFGPYILSNIFLILFVKKWYSNSRYIRKYLQRFDWFLIILSVLCGFYASIDVAISQVFYLDIFNLSLSFNDKRYIVLCRCVNTVLFENVAQLIIQMIYFAQNEKINLIVFNAMLFSIISIVFGLLRFCTTMVTANDDNNNINNNNNDVDGKNKYNYNYNYKNPDDRDYNQNGACALFKLVVECGEFEEYHAFSQIRFRAILGSILKIDETKEIEIYYITKITNGIEIDFEIRRNFKYTLLHNIKIFENVINFNNYNSFERKLLIDNIQNVFKFKSSENDIKITVILQSGDERMMQEATYQPPHILTKSTSNTPNATNTNGNIKHSWASGTSGTSGTTTPSINNDGVGMAGSTLGGTGTSLTVDSSSGGHGEREMGEISYSHSSHKYQYQDRDRDRDRARPPPPRAPPKSSLNVTDV